MPQPKKAWVYHLFMAYTLDKYIFIMLKSIQHKAKMFYVLYSKEIVV